MLFEVAVQHQAWHHDFCNTDIIILCNWLVLQDVEFNYNVIYLAVYVVKYIASYIASCMYVAISLAKAYEFTSMQLRGK